MKKIIIEISDEAFDCIKDRYADGEMPDDESVFDTTLYAIANGTEVKQGHWEYVQYDGNPNIGNWHCSECNRIVCGAITAANPVYAYKYCPECGAKMQEVEDGNK